MNEDNTEKQKSLTEKEKQELKAKIFRDILISLMTSIFLPTKRPQCMKF